MLSKDKRSACCGAPVVLAIKGDEEDTNFYLCIDCKSACDFTDPSKRDSMTSAEDIFKSCLDLMSSRNKQYGKSWKVLSVQSIANLIEMKMNRVAKLGPDAPKTEDEFLDSINYAVFGLIKLYNKKNNED